MTYTSSKPPTSKTYWLDYKPSESPKSAIILIHGLNNNPKNLEDLANHFKELNFIARIVVLKGHQSAEDWPGDLSSKDWIQNIKDAYQDLRANYPDIPIYNLSYSLGAPLTVSFLKSDSKYKFDGIIFIAPALKLKSKSLIMRAISNLHFLGIKIPSFTPKEFRIHSSTSLKAYRALFELQRDSLDLEEKTILKNTPGKIFLRSEDEFIDIKGIENWLKLNQLNWSVTFLNEKDSNLPEHLMINKRSLNKKSWEVLTNEIENIWR